MSLTWIEDNKRKFGIIVILLLMLFITLPILSHLDIWKFKTIYTVTREVANFLYLISGFILVLGLYLTLSQIGLLKTQIKDQSKSTEKQLEFIKIDIQSRNDRLAVEKSIDYLSLFANSILPKMELYWATLPKRKEIIVSNWNPSETDYYLDLVSLPEDEKSEILEELDSRRNKDVLLILNNLELFSAGIIHGLGKEDVVYDPVAGEFIKFISNEIVEISSQRYLGIPYTNTIKLYRIWKSRKKLATETLQIEKLESIIEARKAILEVAVTEAQTIPHIGEIK